MDRTWSQNMVGMWQLLHQLTCARLVGKEGWGLGEGLGCLLSCCFLQDCWAFEQRPLTLCPINHRVIDDIPGLGLSPRFRSWWRLINWLIDSIYIRSDEERTWCYMRYKRIPFTSDQTKSGPDAICDTKGFRPTKSSSCRTRKGALKRSLLDRSSIDCSF